MNDHVKIQVLMIYYQHWGKEQNKIRKSQDGIREFEKCYQENQFMMNMSCRSYLKRHQRRTWYHMTDLLLKECGGGFQPNDLLPKTKDRVGMLMLRTLQQSTIVEEDTYWDLLGVGFDEKNALSVDAIVALM